MSFEDHNDSLGSADDVVTIEQDNIGDWAGHTPKQEWTMEQIVRQVISDGIGDLVTISGENSRDHGFHDDWPVDVDLENPGKDRDYQKAITEKLMLMGEELFESFGEIRSGRDPLETYFVDKRGVIGTPGESYPEQAYDDAGTPLLKPEGFIVEIADLLIRAADLTYLLNGRKQLVEALAIKHEYNATRPFKHGRQF